MNGDTGSAAGAAGAAAGSSSSSPMPFSTDVDSLSLRMMARSLTTEADVKVCLVMPWDRLAWVGKKRTSGYVSVVQLQLCRFVGNDEFR